MVAETFAAGTLRGKCQRSQQTPSAALPDRAGGRVSWAGDIPPFSLLHLQRNKRPPGVVNQPLAAAQQQNRLLFLWMFNVWGHIASVTRSEATAAFVSSTHRGQSAGVALVMQPGLRSSATEPFGST